MYQWCHPCPIRTYLPNNHSVAEISASFHDMNCLGAQRPNMTQCVAFEGIFGSCYVKSTVCWQHVEVDFAGNERTVYCFGE